MKKIVYNNDKLKLEEIDKTITRVKALIINDSNDILLGYSNNIYQFPGGHLETKEEPLKGLIREVKEETGMDISSCEIKPFMKITHLTKNYNYKGFNRKDDIYYYIVNTNKHINLKETSYTKLEEKGNYTLSRIKLNNVENLLIDNFEKYPKASVIAMEMLEVLREYKNSMQ